MSRPSVDWNEFRIDLLKTEWAAGIPMQDIAQHIGGGCTKADVGRKAKALELGHHPSSPSGRRNKQRNSDPQAESEAQQLLETMERSAFQPPPPPAKANTKGGKGKEKPPERITVSNVASCHCRWPYGNPQSRESFHFCGKTPVINANGKQLPYCDFHARIAYRPPAPVSSSDEASKARRR